MPDYSEETKRWINEATRRKQPFGFAAGHGVEILCLVRGPGVRGDITNDVVDDGVVNLRVIGKFRKRQVTITLSPTNKRTELDPTEPAVVGGTLQLTIQSPRCHPEDTIYPEEDHTCRFRVTNTGTERMETTARGFTDLNSHFNVQTTGVVPPVSIKGKLPSYVLVVAALWDEREAFIRVTEKHFGAIWKEETDSAGFAYRQADIVDASGIDRTFVLVLTLEMGTDETIFACTRLISELGIPRMLMMTGICAGHPKHTSMGDVIVANRLFRYDEGGREVKVAAGSDREEEEFFHDIQAFNLEPRLKQAVEDFVNKWSCRVTTARPKTYEHQQRWVLRTLHENPAGCNLEIVTGYSENCPSRPKVIARLIEQRLVTSTPHLKLTQSGVEWVQDDMARHGTQVKKDKEACNALVGPIGTGAPLQKDPLLFERLRKIMRKIIGVEMEAGAIGKLAEKYRIPYLVAKSVVDFATLEKDDNFRNYAAETAASFLAEFVKQEATALGYWDSDVR